MPTSLASRQHRPTMPPAHLTLAATLLAAALPALAAAQQGAAPQSGTITGTVTAAASRAPLADVMVRVEGTSRGAITDAQGRYLIPGVPAGRHAVVAQRMGLRAARDSVTVGAATSADVSFALADQATVVAPVVVSATREIQRRADASATIDVLDGAEVRLARAAHPAQILKRVPGVYVSQLSGEGHSMAIRQPITTKPMYLYLEDGVPTRATGFFNHNALYEVNIPQSGGLEVLKGPGTALYGSDAIGGVVNVLTRPAPASPSAELAVEGGAYGYARLLGTGGFTSGTNGVRADLNLTRMTGWRDDAPYTRESGTVRWDHFDASGLTARTTITASRIDQNDVLTLSQARFDARSPVNRSPLAFRQVQAVRVTSAIEQERGRALWSVTPYARYNVLDLLPSWQLTFDPQVWSTRNTSVGLLAKYRRDFEPMRTRVIAGADVDVSPGAFTADQAVLTTTGTGAERIFERYATGARQYDYDVTYKAVSPYLHAELSPVARLRLDAGLRYDRSSYDYTTRLAAVDTGAHRVPASTSRSYTRLSPKLGATFELLPGMNVFASYRAGFRAPSQGQLFQQNSAANTVDLKPVKVDSYESGVRGQAGKRLVYGVSAYDMTIQDDIITFVTPENRRVATNAGETRHRGIEASAGVAVVPTVRLDLAYAVTSQRYVSWTPQAARPAQGTRPAVSAVDYSGKLIEQAPRDLANALVTWTPKRLKGGRVAGEWTYSGRYAMDPANTRFYGGYGVVNLHANVVVAPSVELFGRVTNIADRNYAELATFDPFQREQYTPGSPRMLYAGARYSWSR
jgi:outer membrane receptor protein involved in Fe transport